VIFKGRKLFFPVAGPQRVPVCDTCSELAATNADVYTEFAADKLWKWFSYPRFSCQAEAFMGCERHPVGPEIRFLDGRVEPYIRRPPTRWQRLTEWDALLVAAFLAIFFAIIVELFVGLIRG
jgi:hypothetical protein